VLPKLVLLKLVLLKSLLPKLVLLKLVLLKLVLLKLVLPTPAIIERFNSKIKYEYKFNLGNKFIKNIKCT